MSTNARRATFLATTAGALLLMSGTTYAQVDQRAAVNVLVECSKIGDPAARLSCYDNNVGKIDPANIRNADAAPAPRLPAPATQSQTPAVASAAPQSGPQGFGAESVRQQQERFEQKPVEERQLTATITAAVQREPGRYLVTLSDGAQWIFTEGVSFGYRPPRPGQTVEIERSSLDGYLLRLGGQAPVPVRRVR